MQVNTLIGGIWKGACHIDSSADGRHFNSLIRALIPVHASVFEMHDWAGDPVAMRDCVEPIPGFRLGDILAEELDADVPFGSLVVIRKVENFQNISRSAGALVGEVLIDLVGRSLFPLMNEDTVLHTLGQAYYNAASADELMKVGLEPAAFRSGLNAVLARYWGRPADSVPIFSIDRFDSQSYLNALIGSGAQMTLNQWTLALRPLAEGRSVRQASEGQRGNVRIA